MKSIRFVFASLMAVLFSFSAWGEEEFPKLDPPYENLIHPNLTDPRDLSEFFTAKKAISLDPFFDAYRFKDTVQWQTPVKSQGSRGTCSIFSGIAMMEAMLVYHEYEDTTLDLSEEFLEYLVMRTSTSEGSNSWYNFSAFVRSGFTSEAKMPYIGQEWKSAKVGKAKERCGHLSGKNLKSCLLGHRDPRLLYASRDELLDEDHELYDPEFLDARDEADRFKEKYLDGKVSQSFQVYSVSRVKSLLDRGIPVTLGLDFYYGAWNHGYASKLGIERNMDHYSKGIVGHPEYGSVDYTKTKKEPAGHSVLVIGYDDNKVVRTRIKMNDGTYKNFTYRGVYYFKNSWGTGAFGREFEVDGKNHPGYGMITQKYAERHGSFYQFPLVP